MISAAFALAWAAAGQEPSVPLDDLGPGTYLGFEGGLYPGGSRTPPADHAALGLTQAAAVRPLDAQGLPSPAGRIVLLSIGMSNTTQEFCSAGGTGCASWSFVGQALADPAVNHATLKLVNGARGGQVSDTWTSPAGANYERIRTADLPAAGATEAQVQVAWIKTANSHPARALPAPEADAYTLVAQMGSIARALRARYPNLRLAYFSSRVYGGYATTGLNPEPYAYESGLAVKWLVEAQIRQERTGAADPRAGDLGPGVAPWIAWGPYLWANGTTPRSDGLVWERADLESSDGTHPSQSGEQKVGALLLAFLKSEATARGWFLGSSAPPEPVARRHFPTVASAPGLLGSFFRTSLQLHNPENAPAGGRLVFHARGTPGADTDPSLAYLLGPGETRSYADVLAAMRLSNAVGSLELLVDAGAAPVALARVFDDAGEAGTTGVSMEALAAEEALQTGERAALLVPADLTAYRLNVGVRALADGVRLQIVVRQPDGTLLARLERGTPPRTAEQLAAADFLGGAALAGGESITVQVVEGSAFVYGATADNRTQDPSLQLARRLAP